jgi:hypothetical protein
MLTLKNLIMYPLIITVGSWSMYQIVKMNEYMGVLRKEAPQCMEENENKYKLFAWTIIFCVFAMYPI